MTSRSRRAMLVFTGMLSLLLLVLFLLNPGIASEPKRPDGARALAQWVSEHPADWLGASALTDRSLDSDLPRRIDLWRAGFGLARTLAPRRTQPPAGFVRAGLFHWYELGPADRKAVLDAAAPLLQRDLNLFATLYRPLWQLTRDFNYLRRAAPRDTIALALLRDLAVANGRFAEYRQLREAVRAARLQQFASMRATADMSELLKLLPWPITKADEPLVRGLLEEIDRRPFDPSQYHGAIEHLAAYAIDHDLKPIAGLAPLVEIPDKLRDPTRVRLARALGDERAALRIELTSGARPPAPASDEWLGLCGPSELCTNAFTTRRGPVAVQLAPAQTDQIAPYVEIYVDDALVAEGEIDGEKTFVVGDARTKRTEVRIVNRLTGGGFQRRTRLS